MGAMAFPVERFAPMGRSYVSARGGQMYCHRR
jgi:hypothetical protein